MELEKQVCSLKLANKLIELGVKQESLFVWAKNPRKELGVYLAGALGLGDEKYAAFAVGELGMELPDVFYTTKTANGWQACHDRMDLAIWSETEAEARAKNANLSHRAHADLRDFRCRIRSPITRPASPDDKRQTI
jgi:hypothetical protein